MKISNFKFQISNSGKGFTLIELLVVVAIIGVLSALLMTNFVGIRQRARDGQRKADLRQIQSALELYRADFGTYPTNLADFEVTDDVIECGAGELLSSGTAIYMKTIPCDPLNTTSYIYQYSGTSTNYCLRACLENANDAQKDEDNNVVEGCTTFSTTCDAPSRSYTLQNP